MTICDLKYPFKAIAQALAGNGEVLVYSKSPTLVKIAAKTISNVRHFHDLSICIKSENEYIFFFPRKHGRMNRVREGTFSGLKTKL